MSFLIHGGTGRGRHEVQTDGSEDTHRTPAASSFSPHEAAKTIPDTLSKINIPSA